MKKIIPFIIGLLIIIMIIFPNKKDNNTIKLSEVTHSVFYTPLYVSIEKGYFKEEGINLELILTPGADKVASAVLSKDADIGFSGPEATIYIYNNTKEKLITFASLTKKDGQFIVGDCKYKDKFTLDDLVGKKILAGRSAGMPLMMFEYALKQKNIDENKIKIDTSVDFANLSGAYIAGSGDFVNLFEPNASKIESEKYGCVLSSLAEYTPSVPYTAFYAREEYINNNKEILRKFNKALNKGIQFTKNNNSTTLSKIISKQFPDTNINTLSKLIERYKKIDAWYPNTEVMINDYYNLIDVMINGKAIDKKPPLEILITNEFNKQITNN